MTTLASTPHERTLYIITAVSNPLGWKSRIALARRAIASWLLEAPVHIILVECAYGNRPYELADLASNQRITYIQTRAKTLLWIKENMLNLGIHRLPQPAWYIAALDADIIWRHEGWATNVMNALDIYPIVQPWEYAMDLGPKGEHTAIHRSFASLYYEGKYVIPRFDEKTWQLVNYPYQYPHPGYGWAFTRDFLEHSGGLFEYGGVGAGDHHMALSFVNSAHMSIPKNVNGGYKAILMDWQSRVQSFPNLKIGYTPHTIEHFFHGRKGDRAYNARWKMFLDHNFDPVHDVKRNTFGILEFAGNKPELEREWDRYLRSRNEDTNTLT